MYACGSTVHDDMHIGNARAAIAADIMYRILIHKYGKSYVYYIRNEIQRMRFVVETDSSGVSLWRKK